MTSVTFSCDLSHTWESEEKHSDCDFLDIRRTDKHLFQAARYSDSIGGSVTLNADWPVLNLRS